MVCNIEKCSSKLVILYTTKQNTKPLTACVRQKLSVFRECSFPELSVYTLNLRPSRTLWCSLRRCAREVLYGYAHRLSVFVPLRFGMQQAVASQNKQTTQAPQRVQWWNKRLTVRPVHWSKICVLPLVITSKCFKIINDKLLTVVKFKYGAL